MWAEDVELLVRGRWPVSVDWDLINDGGCWMVIQEPQLVGPGIYDRFLGKILFGEGFLGYMYANRFDVDNDETMRAIVEVYNGYTS